MKVTCWHKKIRSAPVYFTCTNHMFPYISNELFQHVFFFSFQLANPLFVLEKRNFNSYEHLKINKRNHMKVISQEFNKRIKQLNKNQVHWRRLKFITEDHTSRFNLEEALCRTVIRQYIIDILTSILKIKNK